MCVCVCVCVCVVWGGGGEAASVSLHFLPPPYLADELIPAPAVKANFEANQLTIFSPLW